MADRPILFSGMMVRAIRADQKTKTRRIAKPRRRASILELEDDGLGGKRRTWIDSYIMDPANREWLLKDAPCLEGDVLWLKENYRLGRDLDSTKAADADAVAAVWYEAGPPGNHQALGFGKLRPSIYLRRCWSRETLLCNGIRIERLHAITEDDAIAEGIFEQNVIVGADNAGGRHREITADRFFYPDCPDEGFETAVDAYRHLWEHLNGSESWAANPLVWVISFSRFTA